METITVVSDGTTFDKSNAVILRLPIIAVIIL